MLLPLFLISLFLITMIVVRVSDKDAGLSSFATKSTLLGSPNKAQKYLNLFTASGVLFYLILAVLGNITSN